jgi:hypothetical protein
MEGGVPGAVNIAAEESDLDPVSDPELNIVLENTSWQSAATSPGAFPAQSPAARLFIYLAGIMLILEMVLRTASKT